MLVNQWNNLVQTLVATVVADKPVAEKANDSELCVVAERLTAVRSGCIVNYITLNLPVFRNNIASEDN